MSGINTAAIAVEALVWVTGRPREECARREAELERDLGVDSLSLLELVVTLQSRLVISVPDEVTARIRTVADLQDAVAPLVAAASSSEPTRRTPS
ncbi:acyl carrier protein [Streptomyces marianii]|uniref:acyl carrier protein n=1 Tax=Streptomyces marianii TaxID=1817406 RepID=UPI0014860EA9|nr:acyl carrier protein [Streptomyces marianii]